MNSSAPSRGQLFQYGALALPLAFAGLPLYLYIPDYYMREMGIGLGVIGLSLLFLRVLDTVQDPFFGYISDRWAHKRADFLTSGFIALLVGMGALMYGAPTGISPLAWFIISMLLASAGLSMMSINLTMIGGLWHSNTQARIRISGWRECFGLTGLLIAAMLPPLLQKYFSVPESFHLFYAAFVAFLLTASVLFYRFFKTIPRNHAILRKSTAQAFLFLPSLFKEQKTFYFICFLTHLAASFPAVLFLFFARDYLQAGHYSGLFLALYFLSGVVFMPVWIRLSARTGTEKAWMIAMALACATFIWAFFLLPGQVIAFSMICIVSGIALGADLALPPAMLAQKITSSQSEQTATQSYALLNLMPKLALALASGIAFLALAQVDFTPATQNTPLALSWLVFLYALLPSVIKAAAGILLWSTLQHTGENYEDNQRSHSNGINHVT